MSAAAAASAAKLSCLVSLTLRFTLGNGYGLLLGDDWFSLLPLLPLPLLRHRLLRLLHHLLLDEAVDTVDTLDLRHIGVELCQSGEDLLLLLLLLLLHLHLQLVLVLVLLLVHVQTHVVHHAVHAISHGGDEEGWIVVGSLRRRSRERELGNLGEPGRRSVADLLLLVLHWRGWE